MILLSAIPLLTALPLIWEARHVPTPLALTPSARMSAARTSTPLNLDGKLDEVAWASAPASTDFVQRFPFDGDVPSEPTTVRVLYDEYAVYIGIDCEQRKTPILERLTRRDRAVSVDKLNRREGALDSDQVSVTISSRRDRSSAFRFAVTSAGTLSDGLYFDDTSYNSSWDENWEVLTARTDHGWSAEFRIPLRVLRFEATSHQTWGFNVQRTIALRQEVDEWADIPRTTGGYVSRLGRLEGLIDLQPPRAELELRPFVVGKVGQQDATFGPLLGSTGAANWSHGWTDSSGNTVGLGTSVGLDARWHLTRDLTLDGTFNPDFAQVEADQLVLNLTTIETFYPEKRPFFLEGSDIFSTPMTVLYTRRVGHVPSLPALPAGEAPEAGVGPSAIPGAVKVVGRLTDRTSLGMLSAVTSRNAVPVVTETGAERLRLADPPTLFNVLRLRRSVGPGGGHVGIIGSATNRFESSDLFPMTPKGEIACPGRMVPRLASRCTRDAYVGGVDGRWRSPSGEYAISGQSVVSALSRGQHTRLPDGSMLTPGAIGSGTALNVAKEGGQRWLWTLMGNLYTRKLELNDVGYLGRQNLASGALDVVYRTREPWGPTLETASKLELRHQRNLDGLVLQDYYQINTTVLLRSHWTLFTEVHYRGAYFDDREVGDGTALERAGLWGWEGSVRGDPRGAVAGQLFATVQRLTNGWHADLDGSVLVRPSSRLDFELIPDLSHSSGEPRFVEEQPGGQLMFGRLDAAQIGTTLRAAYTFTPRLTLQAYGQLFLARGRYDDDSVFNRQPTTTPAIHLTDLAPTAATPIAQHDFERAALNATIVLRWEYRLGSLLYLVYSRSQIPQVQLMAGERPRLDISLLPRAPAANVLLLKLSVWLG